MQICTELSSQTLLLCVWMVLGAVGMSLITKRGRNGLSFSLVVNLVFPSLTVFQLLKVDMEATKDILLPCLEMV